MQVRIHDSWREALAAEWDKPYFRDLAAFIRAEYGSKLVFPPASRIFAAFDSCPFSQVKVVILGQDPYHDVGQANGLAFSVADGVRIPPSLLNIYKEIRQETGAPIPASGNLQPWADQGVLLLNATLTVEAHKPTSHQGKGWEQLTDATVKALSESRDNLVFMLWGASARRKGAAIDRSRHLVLEAPHPSPLSAHHGFFGCGHFTKANEYLTAHNLNPIQW